MVAYDYDDHVNDNTAIELYREGRYRTTTPGCVFVLLEKFWSNHDLKGDDGTIYLLTWEVSGTPVEGRGDFGGKNYYPSTVESGRRIIVLLPNDSRDRNAAAIREAINHFEYLKTWVRENFDFPQENEDL